MRHGCSEHATPSVPRTSRAHRAVARDPVERTLRAVAQRAWTSVPTLLLGLGFASVVATSPACADILAVTAGDDWSTIAARAKPGDEIVLGEGIHRPVVLEGLAGTADAPIVIRPAKAGALAEIAP
ncbi:MAG: Chondroitinase, partial [Planctomycetota bacterium]